MAVANAASAQTAAATLQEMREDRRDRRAPKVLVYFASPDSHLAQLVIENAGDSTAADVEIRFDPPLTSSLEASEPDFLTTAKVLPPRSRMTHLFDSWPSYFGKKLPLRYQVTLRYKSAIDSQHHEEHQEVDIGGFQHIRFSSQTGLKEVVTELEKLRRSFEGFARETTAEAVARATREELLTSTSSVGQAVATAKQVWGLLKSLEDSAWVYPDHRGFHLVIRSLIAGAMTRAGNEPRSKGLKDALSTLYEGLSDYRLQAAGDLKEAKERVDAGFEEVKNLLPPHDTSADSTS